MATDNARAERARRLTAIASVIVTLLYLHWRLTETFNPGALAFSWALWAAEVFGAVTTFLFFFTAWKPIARARPQPLAGRTVDVLVPTKNEPADVLRKTILACSDLKYPHRTIVLDDGGRPEIEALCRELGCEYLARTEHAGAKAGNLNFGLAKSTAEFVAVFDADHAPLPHFIDALIGYFADEKLAFAQAPQEFYNIDSFQHRVDHQKKYIWGEQYLFFSLIQPGRDRWNAAYFVGSCAIIRRQALDEVGGFATGSITEDMLTSIRMHQRGWRSVYHNENLAYGIAPETIRPFHIQRRRWGIGGWQVFFKANPLLVRGLSLPQRLCYLASLIYPLEGFQKLIFYATPPIALITGVLPMRALDITYILHFVPYYALSILAFNEMGRGYGGILMLEQFSMGKYATYIHTFFAFFGGRRRRSFDVTPKGASAQRAQPLIMPQVAVLAVSMVAIAYALIMLLAGARNDDFVVAVNSLWALYNSGLGLAIIRYDYRKLLQRRSEFRIPDSVPVLYRQVDDAGAELVGVADNVTGRGLSLLAFSDFVVGEKVNLEMLLPGHSLRAVGTVVQHRTKSVDGLLVSRAGIALGDDAGRERDRLSRYLHESAVMKFMDGYSTRYRTYLERKLGPKRPCRERARRAPACLPAAIRNGPVEEYGVIRNVSSSGMLLMARSGPAPGDRLGIAAILGPERIPLDGVAVRVVRHESEDYPEYLIGVAYGEPADAQAFRIMTIADEVSGMTGP